MFVVTVSTLVATVELVRICRAIHSHYRFIIGTRLINTKRAGVTSAVRVCKVMVLRVLNVEKSDVIGTLGYIYCSARRKVCHGTPERVD